MDFKPSLGKGIVTGTGDFGAHIAVAKPRELCPDVARLQIEAWIEIFGVGIYLGRHLPLLRLLKADLDRARQMMQIPRAKERDGHAAKEDNLKPAPDPPD